MGKALSLVIGLILLAGGIWMTWWKWWLVRNFVYSGLAVLLILVGLGVLLFAISEMRAGPEEPPTVEAPAPPASPGGQQQA